MKVHCVMERKVEQLGGRLRVLHQGTGTCKYGVKDLLTFIEGLDVRRRIDVINAQVICCCSNRRHGAIAISVNCTGVWQSSCVCR